MVFMNVVRRIASIAPPPKKTYDKPQKKGEGVFCVLGPTSKREVRVAEVGGKVATADRLSLPARPSEIVVWPERLRYSSPLQTAKNKLKL